MLNNQSVLPDSVLLFSFERWYFFSSADPPPIDPEPSNWTLVIIFSVAAILVLTIIIYFLIHIYKRYKNETGSRMTRFTNSLRGSLQGFSGRRPSWFNRRTERTMVQSELSATNGKILHRVLFNCFWSWFWKSGICVLKTSFLEGWLKQNLKRLWSITRAKVLKFL